MLQLAPVGAQQPQPLAPGDALALPGLNETGLRHGLQGSCDCADCTADGYAEEGVTPMPWFFQQMHLRHSSTHGRAMGPGSPLRGTSWLNRPFSLSFDTGALLVTNSIDSNVGTANDLMAGVSVGWDWDHYWGAQARVAWSTPNLRNSTQPGTDQGDNLFLGDLSVMYYPWGDSRTRPYYRVGFGLTDVEFTNDAAAREQQTMITLPIGAGFKHQIRRNLAWRGEIVDNIALGQSGTSTLQNFSLTFGVEWRYGGRPDTRWGWSNHGGVW
ncbi:hypothetical protein Mal64_11200 [Pseudobythopirellula maris]|uniref:Outer membrane protein beta-barrel domain-containing protein n=1 Tax=Pseudobythopirellula maris TaxID=2527991 RepID=A0A5C5ZUD6_9BACT|nr:outer membrane beta-barrel protein [Pseudobythopirellula maris]TWT90725.1 hypothetical protein Mal64_11200 [Pseudobythopirellula maris]